MEEKKVKILGVSGSPRRKGNTATMMKFCLESAESMGYVETEFVSLADYRLEHCTGCMRCFGWQAPADEEYQCYHSNDDIKILAPKVEACDGLIVGFPIYAAGVPSLFRCFMEKLHHFGPMSFTKHAGALRFKALGIISQGGRVYGAQETNHAILCANANGLGMYAVDAWPTADAPEPQSTHVGGVVTCVDGTAVYGERAWRKEGCRTVPPVSGSRNERTLKNLGRNMAVTAMTLKLGREAFKAQGFKEPDNISFTRYSVKPRKGSYVDKLIQEGRVKYISKEDLEAEKKERSATHRA
jgi:multimeric flavodoxin WrbA